MGSVGEQVILGGGADGGGEAGAEFAFEKNNHLAHALKRKTAAPELRDDGGGHKLIPGIDAAMALAVGRNQAALVPPLQLPRGDAGERDDLGGGELPFHLRPNLFQTEVWKNVSNILG